MIAGMSIYTVVAVVVSVAGIWIGWKARTSGARSYGEPGAGAVKLGRM